MRLGAVILAAGESRRMGSPKPLLRLGGEAFLEHAVLATQFASPDEIVVVTSATLREPIRKLRIGGVKIVVNPHVERGMAESLRCGLRAMGAADAALVALADHPRVRRDSVAQLAEVAAMNPGRIVMPVADEERGHPVIIPAALFGEIMELEEGRGLNDVIKRHEDLVIEVEMDDEGVLLDIDTPEDFAKLVNGEGD